MRFLDEIFPDSRFIHVRRDPRGVINSIINVDFWWGWRGPQNWRWGELTDEQNEIWERFDRSFVALAGIGLEIMNNALEDAKRDVDPARFVEIDYEDLCERPVDIFRETINFCELDWHPQFERTVADWNLKNTNFKWQEDLTDRQKEIVEFFANRLTFQAGPPINRVPQAVG